MSTKKPSSGFVSPSDLMAQVRAQGGGAQPQAEAPSPVAELGLVSAPVPEKMPWEDAHPKVKIHFGLRIPERLHKRFEYAANHTLGASMQTFALTALEEAVEKRLAELGVK